MIIKEIYFQSHLQKGQGFQMAGFYFSFLQAHRAYIEMSLKTQTADNNCSVFQLSRRMSFAFLMASLLMFWMVSFWNYVSFFVRKFEISLQTNSKRKWNTWRFSDYQFIIVISFYVPNYFERSLTTIMFFFHVSTLLS